MKTDGRTDGARSVPTLEQIQHELDAIDSGIVDDRLSDAAAERLLNLRLAVDRAVLAQASRR